jgi:transposase
MFRDMLRYKLGRNLKQLVEADKFFPSSQLCSDCGFKNIAVKNLTVREWDCPQCGKHHDRDINAARNILRAAIEKYAGEGVPQAGSGSKTPDGIPVRGSRVADVSEVPAKNPTT